MRVGLYEEANAVSSLGMTPHTTLYLRLADLREKMGRPDEAMAWHKLVLVDEPEQSEQPDRTRSTGGEASPPRVPSSALYPWPVRGVMAWQTGICFVTVSRFMQTVCINSSR